MKILITICARGGSRGLRNKALLKINNKPLILHTLDSLNKLKFKHKIVISTDSEKISNVCKNNNYDVWFKRSNKLSTDKAAKIPVIRDAVQKAESYYKSSFDTIIDLDITSPLRKTIDVINSLNKFKKSNCDNLFSVMKSRHSPYFNMVEIKNNKTNLIKNDKAIVRRQDAPKTFDMNASIYIWKKDILFNSDTLFNKSTELYEMPYERSIDIDSKIDFFIVKSIIEANEKL